MDTYRLISDETGRYYVLKVYVSAENTPIIIADVGTGSQGQRFGKQIVSALNTAAGA